MCALLVPGPQWKRPDVRYTIGNIITLVEYVMVHLSPPQLPHQLTSLYGLVEHWWLTMARYAE